MRRTTRAAACLALAVGAVLVALAISDSRAEAQGTSLLANVATLKSDDGTVEFCIDLRDATAGESRQCPRSRLLTFLRAPEGRWLRTQAVDIAPEARIWVRARRLGGQLQYGLGISIEGQPRGIRRSNWVLYWELTPADRWVQGSSVTLDLPVAPHPELWPLEAGIVAGAHRLEVGKAAPEFSLPVLGSESNELRTLSQARARGAQLTLVVFWASWAPFVGETLSVLGDLAAREDDVLVIGINVYEVSAEEGESFIQNYGSDLLHLVDSAGSVAQHYRVDGVPELFVIDSEGIYRGVIRGAAPLTEILSALYGVE